MDHPKPEMACIRDPETGRLRPMTREEMQQLRRAAVRHAAEEHTERPKLLR